MNKAGSRLLLATTYSDWNVLKDAPLIATLQSYIQIIVIDIPEVAPGEDKYAVMTTRAHKLAADLAIANKAYGAFLCPGHRRISTARYAACKKEPRQAQRSSWRLFPSSREQENFLAALYALPAYREDQPLVLSPRELMKLSLSHLHPQVTRRDFDSDKFAITPGALFLASSPRSKRNYFL